MVAHHPCYSWRGAWGDSQTLWVVAFLRLECYAPVSKSQLGITRQELASILGFNEQDAIAMLYRCFIDDSADEHKKIAVIAGALVGSHGAWGKLRPKWMQRLRRDGLQYFRSSEYSNLSGEFSCFRDPVKYPKPKGSDAARQLRNDLEAILKGQHIIGLACVIPMEVYNEFRATVPGPASFFHPDAFKSALQTTLMECGYTVRDKLVGTENRIAFVCDDSPNAVRYSAVYVAFKEKNPVVGKMMGGLVHLDDKKTPQLQVADMMANVTKEIAVKFIETHRAQLRNDPRTNYPGDVTLTRLEGSVYSVSIWNWHWMQEVWDHNKTA